MKRTILALGLVSVFGVNAFGSVYIKYYNKDSQVWTFKVKMDGQNKEVTFNGSTSGATTIGGSGTKAIVETKCGNVEVANDSKIEIKDGCIKFVK
ncbi:MAG: hypothetical protein IPO41_14680 [Acidobacteria bacterium]|nr:hypothetical protein [Acidobacteriota bacterium]MBP7476105.1 hypothetical protein [Pyrinomonadaceae bacterium]MBP9110710.1 hypothetical protein [Pyrinomonadaceae bacterium]